MGDRIDRSTTEYRHNCWDHDHPARSDDSNLCKAAMHVQVTFATTENTCPTTFERCCAIRRVATDFAGKHPIAVVRSNREPNVPSGNRRHANLRHVHAVFRPPSREAFPSCPTYHGCGSK